MPQSALGSCGFSLTADGRDERLTNIRYADDLLLFAKSLSEAEYMLCTLLDSLRSFGLELNAKKTRILTAETPAAPLYLDTRVGFVEILHVEGVHKYLGRVFPGDLSQRARIAVEYDVHGLSFVHCSRHFSINASMWFYV